MVAIQRVGRRQVPQHQLGAGKIGLADRRRHQRGVDGTTLLVPSMIGVLHAELHDLLGTITAAVRFCARLRMMSGFGRADRVTCAVTSVSVWE